MFLEPLMVRVKAVGMTLDLHHTGMDLVDHTPRRLGSAVMVLPLGPRIAARPRIAYRMDTILIHPGQQQLCLLWVQCPFPCLSHGRRSQATGIHLLLPHWVDTIHMARKHRRDLVLATFLARRPQETFAPDHHPCTRNSIGPVLRFSARMYSLQKQRSTEKPREATAGVRSILLDGIHRSVRTLGGEILAHRRQPLFLMERCVQNEVMTMTIPVTLLVRPIGKGISIV